MDGDTPQAQELAQWLRKLTHGLGQRDLEKRFAYGKTTWGEFLMGRKLIPSWLLEDVVNALVREPRARQSQLRRGGELLRAAEKAALEKTAALEEEKPASGSETQLLIRLDEARKGQLQAQETLLSTTQIIYTLLPWWPPCASGVRCWRKIATASQSGYPQRWPRSNSSWPNPKGDWRTPRPGWSELGANGKKPKQQPWDWTASPCGHR
ncbi:hypothetical protein [Streptomyces sp. YGL11-2]|uniref:hypothetical protein n=1 Tax=Streptomyces sp. YGL11-2 TaxID=3414028 RepID=UPI003CE88779